MRLKKNRAERDRELLAGLARAPEAFAGLAESTQRMAEALLRLGRAGRSLATCCSRVRSRRDGKR